MFTTLCIWTWLLHCSVHTWSLPLELTLEHTKMYVVYSLTVYTNYMHNHGAWFTFLELILRWILGTNIAIIMANNCIVQLDAAQRLPKSLLLSMNLSGFVFNSGSMYNSGSSASLSVPGCILLDAMWGSDALPHVGCGLFKSLKEVVVLPHPWLG